MATSLPANGALPGAQAQEKANNMLKDDAARRNIAVHTFDPDASPEQKAASAGKARDQLKSKTATPQISGRGASGYTAPPCVGSGNVVPTITIEDVDRVTKEQGKEEEGPQPPGALPSAAAAAIPDWYKVGWRAFTDLDNGEEDEDQKQRRMLNAFISEQYYGEWYHNAALIVFAVLAAHFLTRFHFGWGWLFIVLAGCCTYYTTSMARVRQRARDDIQRDLVKTNLASEHESAEWLNHFLERFWLIYEPVLSSTIVASVDQVLSTSCPPFLESMRLSSFTLGSKAPRIDKVRTFPKTPDDIVMMDWGLSFTPNDISDLTPRQQATKVNPKVLLSIRVGKGVASASMPILVEDMTFSGLMRIRMKLMTNFPHVQIVDISFLEKPVIDYVLKPIGGETFGFDIANIPGLSSFIRDMIHSILGPMMYDPNVFTLNLEQLLSGTPLDTAIGVIKVTVHSARSIKGNKIGGGTPDPYVSLSINNRAELAKTKWKESTYVHNPTWNETKFILINNVTENLILTVLDYNEHRKDTELGAASFELSKLNEDAIQDGLEAHILKDGKERGELRFDISYFPVLAPQVNASGVEELPESSVGIVRFVLHQAKDLDTSKIHTHDLNPFAKVFLGASNTPIHSTPKVKHTVQPVWESATEFLCTDRSDCMITVNIIDDRDFLKDPVIGHATVRLEDLLTARKEAGRDWWPLSGCSTGRIRISAEWKPLNMAGSLHGAEQYTPPIGAVRLWLKKASDVKNVEATLGGKSDPYVRVLVNNTVQSRTEVVNNHLNPEWDQIVYTPVHSLKETMLLELMDYQHLTKDRSLGTCELKVRDLAVEVPKDSGDPRFRFVSTGKKEVAEPIRLDRGNTYKGQLHYVAEFIPAIALKGVKFQTGPNELQKVIENGSEGSGRSVDSVTSSVYSSHEEPNGLPAVTVSKPMADESECADPKATGHVDDKGRPSAANGAPLAPASPTKNSETANSTSGDKHEEEGIQMTKEELLKQQSGIIVFHVKRGELAKKGRLEVLLDDAYWPTFSTPRAHGHRAEWEHVGEGFLKELDFGRVWLRFNEADEGDKDAIFGEWKGDAKAFLEQTLDGSFSFSLVDQEEKVAGTVEIEARYVPVPVVLEPRESINNQGVLRVNLIDGREIHGVDRGGKSDPFAVFTLNGTRVYKSQTKKKTLTPSWNEDFVVTVPSRVGADFRVEIFDWNQIEQAKSLGFAQISLEDIEPFNAVERNVTLSSDKHGEKGQIRVSLMFQPEIIAKSRKNTSTFSAAGRAMTSIGTAPLSAGKGVFHGVTGVFKKGKDGDQENGLLQNGLAAQNGHAGPQNTQDLQGSQVSQPVGGDRMGAPGIVSNPMNGSGSPPPEFGNLRVTVLDAKDLSPGSDSVKPYVSLRFGDKEHKTKHAGKTVAPEWNESFDFFSNGSARKLYASIFDHKTLGKDKLLGEAEVDVWQHIQPVGESAADVFVELREGSGILKMRLAFNSEPQLSGRKSTASIADQSITSSPSKFSLRRQKPGSDRDE
ncbi:tricalbin [Artomyces pyxidatus]|uniref:Tricalbin n=1 Tax=Artomyces pyxidatus TaxID=48021 RepID=A0ACB8THN1_9AGAM|nr:tricalbin [Artomyces pyxidatus]